MDHTLTTRRSPDAFTDTQPTRPQLGRLLHLAHGITGADGRGPVPSAGGLQGLELYLAVLAPGWLGVGAYHFDRTAHALSLLEPGIARPEWEAMVPVLPFLRGGAILWLLVGDGARVMAKYGERGRRFLLLEAGHLMQNLCLVSASLGLGTRPLGGYFEDVLARRLHLLPTDDVLYLGLCGVPARGTTSRSG
jgi:SagB-type dehydrogenase family enzyme